jgi:hypothetical protein
MMSQMGLSQLHFVVTVNLANKLSLLIWKAHPKDLSQGIHPFCVGEKSPNAIAVLPELAWKYDPVSSNGATPSIMDARELVGVGKAAVPRNLIMLDAHNQLFLMLLRVCSLARLMASLLHGSNTCPVYSTATVELAVLHSPHGAASVTLAGSHPTLVSAMLQLLAQAPVEQHE